VQLLPQVIWTFIPSCVLWWHARRIRDVGRVGAGLMIWIAAVVAAHMILGMMGYSKIVRYIVLVTPATCVLFALTFSATVDELRRRPRLTIGAECLWCWPSQAWALKSRRG
jgi:hypothetical protein